MDIRPLFMSNRPDLQTMDLLTDLLQQAGLRRRLLDSRRLAAGAALQFPCERSMGLHVVTQGQAWVHAPSLDEPLALAAGDIAVMARGCHHVLATQPVLHAGQAIPSAYAARKPAADVSVAVRLIETVADFV